MVTHAGSGNGWGKFGHGRDDERRWRLGLRVVVAEHVHGKLGQPNPVELRSATTISRRDDG